MAGMFLLGFTPAAAGWRVWTLTHRPSDANPILLYYLD